MMKKSLLLAMVLSALLLVTVMAVSVSADPSLTIGEVSVVKDADNNLVTFTVPYTAVDVDQITLLATKGPVAAAPTETEDNIVYVIQQSSATSSFTFSVALDEFDATNPVCWIKIGGTAIATAQSAGGETIWSESVPAFVFGDVSGDDKVTLLDVSLLSEYVSVLSVNDDDTTVLDTSRFPDYDFPNGSDAAKVSDDAEISLLDISLVSEYVSVLSTNDDDASALDASRFPGGKFPNDK